MQKDIAKLHPAIAWTCKSASSSINAQVQQCLTLFIINTQCFDLKDEKEENFVVYKHKQHNPE